MANRAPYLGTNMSAKGNPHLEISTRIHPVSITRFPSFRTQTLENLSHYLWKMGS